MHWDAKQLFKILPFNNIFIECNLLKKHKIKTLSNLKLLQKLPFYEELNIVKSNSAFSGYARSCKIEIVDKKDPLVQLEVSKSSIKKFF